MTKILSLLLALGLASVAHALPGDLDESFSSDGKVITDVPGIGRANAVAIQADGKIVVAGEAAGDFAVVRYNASGSLDTSFGGDGIVTTDFGSSTDRATAIAIQADGNIVVAGASGILVAIARYRPDGTLDTAFSGDGRLTQDVRFIGGTSSGATALAIQPVDGKIVVAGDVTAAGTAGRDWFVARFNPDGTLDTQTFNNPPLQGPSPGIVTNNFGTDDRAAGVAIQPDGRIVVAGTTNAVIGVGCNLQPCFAVMRFTPEGFADGSFGDGLQFASFGTPATATGLALQSDGKIVVVGTVGPSECLTSALAFCSMAVARFTPDGVLDETFSSDGLAPIDFADFARADSEARAVAIQPDGKIVVAGTVNPTDGPISDFNVNFAVARLNVSGTLDTSFGGDGRVITDFGGATNATLRSDRGSAVAIQPNDGRIVVAGTSNLTFTSIESSFAVARYHAFTCNGVNVTIVGTNRDDTIFRGFGRRVNDVIHGLGGDDEIDGGDGDDIICGGNGNDILRGGLGNDILIAGIGFDQMDGGGFLSFPGNDTCVGSDSGRAIDPPDSFIRCETVNTGSSGVSGEWLEVAQQCNRSSRNPSCRVRGSLRVFNPGTEGTAVPSLVAFYLSEDQVLDANDTFLTTESVRALDAGKERVVRFNHKVAGAGDLSGRFIIAVVDFLDNVPEVNEENNVVVSPPL
jgi:uncharacterized delta-60 repeat protein